MSYSTDLEERSTEDEFCRTCGVSVTWTGEEWVHDYAPGDCDEPNVPWDPYD